MSPQTSRNFKFQDNYLFISTLMLFALSAVYVFSAWLREDQRFAVMIGVIFLIVSILRVILITQSPKNINVNSETKLMEITPRFPKNKLSVVDLRNLKSLEVSMTVGRFSYIRLRLIFDIDVSSREVFFRPVSFGSFFSVPREKSSKEIDALAQFLQDEIINKV